MLNLLIRLFAKVVCPSVSISITDSENCYDHMQERIFINPYDLADYGFMRHLREVHNCSFADEFSYRLWAVLHEIGHYHTLDYCESDELLIRGFCALCDGDTVETQDLYFNLESEWEATEWAMEYIENHKALCRVFNKLIKEK